MKLMESGLHSPGSVAKWKDQPNSIHGAGNYCKGVCKNIDALVTGWEDTAALCATCVGKLSFINRVMTIT